MGNSRRIHKGTDDEEERINQVGGFFCGNVFPGQTEGRDENETRRQAKVLVQGTHERREKKKKGVLYFKSIAEGVGFWMNDLTQIADRKFKRQRDFYFNLSQ